MSFAAAAYGSAGYGGLANAVNEQVFFPLENYVQDVLYERQAIFKGTQQWYEILTQQASEPASGSSGITYEVKTSHSEGETPQLQATIEGNGQTIIAAAPLIVVTAFIDSAVWPSGNLFKVTGRPIA